MVFSIAFPVHAMKKTLHYLILLKRQRILSFYLQFWLTQKILESVLNELKITLEQRLNKTLDQH